MLSEADPSTLRSIPTIHISNAKGGVGKTSLVLSLATALAQRGLRVLVVDLDPQAHTTALTAPSLTDEEQKGRWLRYMSQLSSGRGVRPWKGRVDGLSYLPGDYLLVDLEHALQSQRVLGRIYDEAIAGRLIDEIHPSAQSLDQADRLAMQHNLESLLADTVLEHQPIDLKASIIGSPHVQADIDIILLDTAPTAAQLMASALQIATHYLIVTTPSELSLHGTLTYAEVISVVEQGLNPDIQSLGVLVNQFRRRRHDEAIVAQIADIFGDDAVFKQRISFDTRWDDAVSGSRFGGVTRYFRSATPKEEMEAVTEEFLDRLALSGYDLRPAMTSA